MNLNGKNILLVGLAKTGTSTIKHLIRLGANVTVNDLKDEKALANILDELKDYESITYILGTHPSSFDDIDLAVVSPGVPLDLPFITKLKESDIEVIGEVELAYRLSNGPVFIGITGTNGKTTTTSLTGSIFKNAGKDTHVVGNIGNPVIDTTDIADKNSFIIAELSSFQLESIDTFRPNISAILNITEDHLNRHHTVENYINAKARITMNQRPKDFCVINYDDPTSRSLADNCLATIVFFSRKDTLESGVYVDSNNNIVVNLDKKEILMNADELKLPGSHNLENALAAVAMAYICGIDLDVIRDTLRNFGGVEHRLEPVRVLNDITFVNDSKATNPDSTIKAIQSYNRPIVLIAGGLDKHSDFNELLDIAKSKVKSLILLGETSEQLAELAKSKGFKKIHQVNTMEEAVNKAYSVANIQDVVLLSPACASWDMYKNFEARGNDFKYFVNTLA